MTDRICALRSACRAPRALPMLLAALAVGFGSSACGSSPTPRFYTINAIEATEQASATASPLAVVVGPITIPRYLQRPQIVSRTGDSRLRYDEFNRWGGSLESEVLRVLGENLATLLATERVVVYPRRAVFPTDYAVRFDFERFDAQRGEELVLKVRWVVLPPAGGDALAVESTTIREPLASSKVKELVRAHGAALETLSRAVAGRLEKLAGS